MSGRTRRKLRVLYCAAEAAPFVKTGGLGDVAGSLPHELKRCGCKVAVMLPKYKRIKLVVPVFVPAIFSLYFDLFDGLIQTYVFVFLTSLFMKETMGDEE